MRRSILLLVLFGAVSCGRDGPTSGLGSVTGSGLDTGADPLDVPSFDGELFDIGASADLGSPRDFGLPGPDLGLDSGVLAPDVGPVDAPLSPDFGPSDVGGSPLDLGFPVVDGGFLVDGGAPNDGGEPIDGGGPPFDLGSPFDVGAPFDAGSFVDSGRPLDAGVPPDLSVDAGGRPDFGPLDTGLSDLGMPDLGADAGAAVCPGNRCAAPIALRGQVGLQTVTGNTRCATNDQSSTCSASRAADVVHEVRFGQRRRLVVRSNSIGGGFLTALSLRRQCDVASTELACNAGSGSGLAVLDTFVDPGTYYLWLDGATAGAEGNYRIDVEVDPQNTCLDPIPLAIPAVGSSVEIQGDTTGAVDTFQAACAGGARSPDHVVEVTVAGRSRLLFETLSPSGGAPFDTALHLRERCLSGVAARELACDDDGGAGTLSRLDVTLEPGTYFLVMDGFSTNRSGPYRLRVTRQSPPPRVRFPTATDTFQTRTSSVFSQLRDSVEGTRSPPGSSSTSALGIELSLSNNTISCGVLILRVSINNRTIGSLFVRAGDTQIRQTLSFVGAPVSAPYRIRYEAANSLPMSCGGTGLDLSNSFMTFN